MGTVCPFMNAVKFDTVGGGVWGGRNNMGVRWHLPVISEGGHVYSGMA